MYYGLDYFVYVMYTRTETWRLIANIHSPRERDVVRACIPKQHAVFSCTFKIGVMPPVEIHESQLEPVRDELCDMWVYGQ